MEARNKVIKKNIEKNKSVLNKMVFIDHYPEENRVDCIECITDALFHIGVFEDIKKRSNNILQ
jgi:hypothetical protein